MSFVMKPNTHVKIYKNDVLPPGPPVGVPAFDGAGQLMVPWLVSGLPSPWRHRLVLAPGSISLSSGDINSTTTQCWVQVIDDIFPDTYQWYKVSDISVSSQEDPANPGQYMVTAVFLALVLSL